MLQDSGARVVIAEDYDAVRTLWRIRARIRDVDQGRADRRRLPRRAGALARGAARSRRGAAGGRAARDRPAAYAVRRQGLAAIVYEPDDDGRLRGVRLTHGALTYQAAAVASLGVVGEPDLLYLCLPLDRSSAASLLAVPTSRAASRWPSRAGDRSLDSLALVRPTVVGLTPALLRGGARARRGRRTAPGCCAGGPSGASSRRVREVFGDAAAASWSRPGPGLDAGDRVLRRGRGDGVEAYGRPETGGAACVALPDDRATVRRAGRCRAPTQDRGRRRDPGVGPGLMEGYHRRRRRPPPRCDRDGGARGRRSARRARAGWRARAPAARARSDRPGSARLATRA